MVDVADSVRLMHQDAAGYVSRWSQFVDVLRHEVLPRHGGRIVKMQGDGFLLDFEQTPPAAAAAVELHDRIQALNIGRPENQHLRLRAGAEVGDVVIHELDDLGDAVNVAARLMQQANPGQTLVSTAFRDDLVPGLDADVEDLGPLYLKGMEAPVRAYALHGTRAVPQDQAAALPRVKLAQMTARLAVLPFDMSHGQADLALLGDAVADELIQVLSRNASLTVISRLSTSAFRNRTHELALVQQHLAADLVLKGRLHLHGDHLRLLVELVDAADATVIWTQSADTSTQGLFSGHDPVLQNLATQMMETLALRQVDKSRRMPMATLQSYCLLMAAVKLLHGSSRTDFERARLMLDHLISRDRRHPAPHTWLAKWHVIRVQQEVALAARWVVLAAHWAALAVHWAALAVPWVALEALAARHGTPAWMLRAP